MPSTDGVGTSDVVIIGAGSAGAVLASRLTEDAARTVTLIEAGPNYTAGDTVWHLRTKQMNPAMDTAHHPEYFWMGFTASRSAHQEREFYFRGRGVGGSSAINGGVAYRPSPEDFENWVDAGCKGWSWQDVLPYFIKMEDDEMFGDEPYHGRGGPIPVGREPVEGWSGYEIAFRDATESLGYPWQPDTNAPDQTGVGYYPFNFRNEERVSTNVGYLEPARGRANLELRCGALVDRLLFDGDRAVGVRLVGGDGPEDVFGGEILLCAGTAGSAGILMRSGIGHAQHLRELGVPVRADLPVGDNVQDHANVSVGFALQPGLAQGSYRPSVCLRYTTGLGGGGRNDAFIGASGPWGEDAQVGSLMAWLNQPFSQGTLRLVSADPSIDPVADINLLADERDRIRSRDIIRHVFELFHQPAIEKVAVPGTGRIGRTVPVEEVEQWSDGELEAFAHKVVRDVAHMTGTCRMGDPADTRTVVDPQCRVLGTEGLRVIDASVIPLLTRANTNFPTIMMAERMADVMRGAAF